MKIACYTTTYWKDKAYSSTKSSPELFRWERNVRNVCDIDTIYMIAGTYSDPEFNPLNVKLINCNLPYNPYIGTCAMVTGIWYFLLCTDCDVLFYLCQDGLVGQNISSMLNEFCSKSELAAAPNWGNMIDNACFFLKRDGAKFLVHRRLRPDASEKEEMLDEYEFAKILENKWWNNWVAPLPEQHFRYDGWVAKPSEDVILREWPILIRPTKELAEKYLAHRGLL